MEDNEDQKRFAGWSQYDVTSILIENVPESSHPTLSALFLSLFLSPYLRLSSHLTCEDMVRMLPSAREENLQEVVNQRSTLILCF